MKKTVYYLSETNRQKQSELLQESIANLLDFQNHHKFLYGPLALSFDDPIFVSNLLKHMSYRKELIFHYKNNSKKLTDEEQDLIHQQIDKCNDLLRELLLL